MTERRRRGTLFTPIGTSDHSVRHPPFNSATSLPLSHIFFHSNRKENLTNRIYTVLDCKLRLRKPKQLRRAGKHKI